MGKRGVSLSILLLVISTFVLIGLSLTFFVIKEKDSLGKVEVFNDLDEVYARQELIDFYVQDIFDKASSDFIYDQGVEFFIENFKRELLVYKDSVGNYPINELALIEEVDVGSVELNFESLVLIVELNVKIRGANFDADYNYEKRFKKKF